MCCVLCKFPSLRYQFRPFSPFPLRKSPSFLRLVHSINACALYLQVPSLTCLIPSSVSLISSKISTFKSLTTFFKLPHSPGDMMPFCLKMSSTLTTSSVACSLGVVRKSLQFCRHLGHASPINTVTENCNSIRTLSFGHSMCKTILCNHKINC